MKFKAEDGSEWEGSPTRTVEGTEYGVIKRIQPKEKRLYSACKVLRDLSHDHSVNMGVIKLLCDTIESLEKRVEELEKKAKLSSKEAELVFVWLTKLAHDVLPFPRSVEWRTEIFKEWDEIE